MNWLLHTVNVMNSVLPVRETFGVRRMLANKGGISVGKGTRITHGVKFYDRHITIGSAVWIGMNTVIASTDKGHITIADNVDIAPCCRILSGTHEIGSPERRAGEGSGGEIVIGQGPCIGASTTILAGARIGSGSIIAAGSVVIAGEYPPNTLLAGIPAAVKRTLPNN
jgi:acetyltransferase-like isoleucine patch superfamily enzyme